MAREILYKLLSKKYPELLSFKFDEIEDDLENLCDELSDIEDFDIEKNQEKTTNTYIRHYNEVDKNYFDLIVMEHINKIRSKKPIILEGDEGTGKSHLIRYVLLNHFKNDKMEKRKYNKVYIDFRDIGTDGSLITSKQSVYSNICLAMCTRIDYIYHKTQNNDFTVNEHSLMEFIKKIKNSKDTPFDKLVKWLKDIIASGGNKFINCLSIYNRMNNLENNDFFSLYLVLVQLCNHIRESIHKTYSIEHVYMLIIDNADSFSPDAIQGLTNVLLHPFNNSTIIRICPLRTSTLGRIEFNQDYHQILHEVNDAYRILMNALNNYQTELVKKKSNGDNISKLEIKAIDMYIKILSIPKIIVLLTTIYNKKIEKCQKFGTLIIRYAKLYSKNILYRKYVNEYIKYKLYEYYFFPFSISIITDTIPNILSITNDPDDIFSGIIILKLLKNKSKIYSEDLKRIIFIADKRKEYLIYSMIKEELIFESYVNTQSNKSGKSENNDDNQNLTYYHISDYGIGVLESLKYLGFIYFLSFDTYVDTDQYRYLLKKTMPLWIIDTLVIYLKEAIKKEYEFLKNCFTNSTNKDQFLQIYSNIRVIEEIFANIKNDFTKLYNNMDFIRDIKNTINNCRDSFTKLTQNSK